MTYLNAKSQLEIGRVNKLLVGLLRRNGFDKNFSGGKGRTGTMICVWMIETGVFTSAGESLDYFGHRRTDTNVSKKFQVVNPA
jgi:hypothetical protein